MSKAAMPPAALWPQSRAQQALLAVNVVAVVLFALWGAAAVDGRVPVSPCCEVPDHIEMILAALNLPSWALSLLASHLLLPGEPTRALVLHLSLWPALAIAQWLLYFRIWSRLRRPRGTPAG